MDTSNSLRSTSAPRVKDTGKSIKVLGYVSAAYTPTIVTINMATSTATLKVVDFALEFFSINVQTSCLFLKSQT